MSATSLLADLVALVHLAYVCFVVLGQAAILVGLILRRSWAKNLWFRTIHLVMIGVVMVESWVGFVCPLTTLEKTLRRSAGQNAYQADFLQHWVHRVLFFQAPPWVFAILYTAFGACVVLTFVLAPPRLPRRRTAVKP